MNMADSKSGYTGSLIPKHGGYRKLKSFQLAQLVYDLTVRFCDKYISIKSRTHDQMVQAARSGVQNIAEGSQASGTSKKTELKLTNVARASLEELKLDYEDFLRQHDLPQWTDADSRRKSLVDKRCKTAEEVAAWIREQHAAPRKHPAKDRLHGPNGDDRPGGQRPDPSATHPAQPTTLSLPSIESIPSIESSTSLESYACLAANAVLVMIGVTCSLLDRQLKSLADDFEQNGGFTEKLYRSRSTRH